MNTQEKQAKLERYLSFLNQDQENSNLLLAVSNCYADLENWDQAQHYLDKASQLNPQACLKQQAILYLNQGKVDQAIDYLEKSLAYYGYTAESSTLLAQLYFDQGDQEKAKALCEKILDINPQHYEARIIQLMLALTLGEKPKQDIENLLAENPSDCRPWFASGTIAMHELEFTKAEKAFTKAAELEPDFYDNWISLGWCQLFQDKLTAAEDSYRKALALSTESDESWGGLALVAALQGKEEEAEQLILKAKDLNPESFISEIAEITLANQNDPKRAGELFNETFPGTVDKLNAAIALLIQEKEQSILH